MNSSGNLVHDYSGIPAMNLGSNPMPDANRFMMDSAKLQDSRKFMERLMTARHKEMATDTQRLLALANQLKAETDSEPRQIPAPVAMHHAEQIEKLAHSVREKMKASVLD